MKRNRTTGQRGVTLMEMLVVVAIVSVIFIMSYSLLEDAVRTSLFIEEHTDLPIFAQSAVNAIAREVLQARTVFDGTAGSFGPAYFAAVDQTTLTYPMVPNKSQMPIANSSGNIVPDTTTRYVGNCLLVARQLEPAPIQLASGTWLMVDRYVFELFYLTNRTNRKFSTANRYVDVIQAKSAVYADYFQLNQWSLQVPAPSAADKTLVHTKLRTWVDVRTNVPDPILQAWDPGLAVGTAIFDINSNGTFTGPINNPKIAIAKSVSLIPALSGGRMSGKMDYSVGFRPTAGTTWPIREPIPKYAAYDPSFIDFPAGLEFLIVGPTGSRRVFTRLVVMASYGKNYDSKEVTVITSSD